MKLVEAWQEYYSYCEDSGFSALTLKSKRSLMKRLVDYIGNIEVNNVSLLFLKNFLNKDDKKYSSYNKDLANLKAFWNFLSQNEYIETDITRKIPRRKPRKHLGEIDFKKIPRALDDEQVIELLVKMKTNASKTHYLITVLLFETGGRKNEILRIKRYNIHPNFIFLDETKFNKPRKVPISEKVYQLIQEYIKEKNIDSPYLFARSDDHSKPVSESFYEKVFYRIRQGMVNPRTGHKIRIHDTRHTFITKMGKILSRPEVKVVSGISCDEYLNIYTDYSFASMYFESAQKKIAQMSSFLGQESKEMI